MKRILFVESATQAGGSTISLYQLARRLDRQVFEPVILLRAANPFRERFSELGLRTLTIDHYAPPAWAYPPAWATKLPGVGAERIWSRRIVRRTWRAAELAGTTLRHTLPAAYRVAAAVRAHSIDLVHLNDALPSHKAGLLGALLARRPVICHVRSMPPFDPLDRLLAGHVAHYIFISRAVEDQQRSHALGGRPGSVIYNALDLTAYERLDRAAARRALGLAADDWVVAMTGRLVPWKGQRELLAALAQLAPSVPRLRCLIAGAPEHDTSAYEQELRALAHALYLGDAVRFMGFVDDMPALLATADVLVHAATKPEPFGRVLIEGMAAGLPIVATRGGGVPEIVSDGESGLLVPPADAPALTAALARLHAGPDAARAMGQQGRRRAAALFGIDKHLAAVQGVYRQVLRLPPAA